MVILHPEFGHGLTAGEREKFPLYNQEHFVL